MYDEKAWWASKGVGAGVVTALAGLAGMAGYDIDKAAQGEMVDYIMQVLPLAVATIGGLVGVWGRVKATKVIKKPQA